MVRVLVLALLTVGCTETVDFGSGKLAGLVALDIKPSDATATVTDLGAGPVAIELFAIGTFVDGTRRDVSKLVEWSVDNPAPGAIVDGDGVYLTTNAAGGRVTVRARALVGDSAIEAEASLHVIIDLALVDGVFPPPVGAEGLFAPDFPIQSGDPSSPSVLYPSTGTLFPQDLARIVFQLAPGASTDAFRWRLDSDSLHISVLTGGTRWQPDGAVWSLIAATHPGAGVQLGVEAASSSQPGTIYASPEITMGFSRGGADGVLYHWSQGTSGVLRSTLASEAPSRLYPVLPDTTCVGCHAVSRDGKQMALGYDGENLRTVDLETVTPIVSGPLRPMGWAAFSPMGDLIVTADKGTLTLRDAKTGNTVGPNMGKIPLPMTLKATHPDWSPDGHFLAVTLTPDTVASNMTITGGAIARIEYTAGVWGPTEILVTGSATNNNYFPKYSPDGRYLIYVHADGPSQGAPSAELRIINANGGVHIPLAVASHRVGIVDAIPNLANTMPTWAPSIDEDLAWIAFASARPYGEILPTSGLSQVWVAGIDLSRAEAGVDPSFAAFWLPSQDVRVINNNPIWAPHVQPTN